MRRKKRKEEESYCVNDQGRWWLDVVNIPDLTGKMQLTLILPNGIPSTLNVDASTPMMDLLIQAASNHKLNPSSYSLVVLDSNNHVIQFKPSQTVAQIGSSTISLLPKEREVPKDSTSASKKNQPFEITVRLQVNLPDQQKILLRVDPTLPLYEIKEQICKQKQYTDTSKYTLRLPTKLHDPLLLGLSLAEYKTNELMLVHVKQDEKAENGGGNQLQSFDRLYRVRSESQPPNKIQTTSPDDGTQTTTKERLASGDVSRALSTPTNIVQKSSTSAVPIRTSHPVTSHTTLHAYWNDPNFDAQSQSSTTSSKKRRAPKAPGSNIPSPQLQQQLYDKNQQIIYVQSSPTPYVGVPVSQSQYVYPQHYVQGQASPQQYHISAHRSQESIDDNNNLTDTSEQNGDGTRRKRKAPTVIQSQERKEGTFELNWCPLLIAELLWFSSLSNVTQHSSSINQHHLTPSPENGITSTVRTSLSPPTSSPVNNTEPLMKENLSEELRTTTEVGQHAFDEDEKLNKPKVPEEQTQKIELTIVDGAKLLNFLSQQQSGTPLIAAETRRIMTDASTQDDREQLYSKIQKTQQQDETAYPTVKVYDSLTSPHKEEEQEKNMKQVEPLASATTTESLENTNYSVTDSNQVTSQNLNKIVADVHTIADKQQSSVQTSPLSQQSSVQTSPLPQQQQQKQKRGKDVQIKSPKSPKSPKSSKKSQTIEGLWKIMTDHQKRADEYRALPETQSLLKEKTPPLPTLSSSTEENGTDEKSYYRAAKSRHGRFETDDRGFVNASAATATATAMNTTTNQEEVNVNSSKLHDYANRPQSSRNVHQQQPPISFASVGLQQQQQQQQQPPLPPPPPPPQQRPQTKGKAAYEILKKYEKEDQEQQEPIDTDYLNTKINSTSPPALTSADNTVVAEKEKSPTPIQLEVTERTTHIKVTVESDRKQLITRVSPSPVGPPPVAPKPFGKTITEYRTVRRIGGNSSQHPINQYTEISSTIQTKSGNPSEGDVSGGSSQEAITESIRKSDGSQNLGKKDQINE
ncbi:unnamed protein product [Didymodactylos carnosus]|uniref:Uncharacterized protein n=1 Tax=Didymodactylos carnosus TaxID=1234261 RepID=A0A814CX36_9BILA|nr:unnamed protein product [Didymodactylos carnosus]CAF0945824.1 unnamed protein product [Didymodactylos carnosus]CAF3639668.1 unnamed protein product [Didymodactylos carnosus]CAF3721976.1 unnamed protein product [Didymodactylos carnosus]